MLGMNFSFALLRRQTESKSERERKTWFVFLLTERGSAQQPRDTLIQDGGCESRSTDH
jgi:hypothetical protein